MVIEHNMAAMNAQRQVGTTGKRVKKSSEKLSSGYQINKSADDAAGLQISNKMRWQIKGLNRGADNIQDGKSLIDVADGALEEVHSILQRMNELSVQAANDTNTDTDRDALQAEVDCLAEEIDRISEDTMFNTRRILDDAYEKTVSSLVKSKSAKMGYMKEAIQGKNGLYYSAAKLDFSRINASNVSQLHDLDFSFDCSQNCNEVFEFKFIANDANAQSTATNNGRTHQYIVNVTNCTSGEDVVKTLFDFVKLNNSTLTGYGASGIVADGLQVSHANDLMMEGSNLYIYRNWGGLSSSAASKFYPAAGYMGTLQASALIKPIEVENEFHIQCSSNTDDYQVIKTHRVNSDLLNVDILDLSNHKKASEAITAVEKAIEKISGYRSELGAYTNRLEKSFNNANNTAENTQSAESRIADTDMAEELTNYSKEKILMDVGNTILAQANSSKDTVLQLLQ